MIEALRFRRDAIEGHRKLSKCVGPSLLRMGFRLVALPNTLMLTPRTWPDLSHRETSDFSCFRTSHCSAARQVGAPEIVDHVGLMYASTCMGCQGFRMHGQFVWQIRPPPV
jgi:hypothetical protein